MTCPTDRFGRPKCHITAHPDRPHDKFCSTCNRRYYQAEDWNNILFLILGVLALLILAINRSQQPSQPASSIPTGQNVEYIIHY